MRKTALFLGSAVLICAAIVTLRQWYDLRAEVKALRAEVPGLVAKAADGDLRPARALIAPAIAAALQQAEPPPTLEAERLEDAEAGGFEKPTETETPLDGADERAHADELRANADWNFRSESYDAGWAPGAEDTIEAALQSKVGKSSRISTVGCRTNLCKVEVTHADGPTQFEFAQSALSYPPFWSGETLILRDENADGSVRSVVFLSRPGQGIHRKE